MIGIDVAHAKLVYGLVTAHKPKNILEFGYGDGISHAYICMGACFNNNKPAYTLVDSWHDWGFNKPVNLPGRGVELSEHNVITSEERSFVFSCMGSEKRYDFIMSDADHQHTQEWAYDVYTRMLASPGILIYHDADNDGYPGIRTIRQTLAAAGAQTMLFNRSTCEEEECGRGLLVIYKP